MTAKAPARRDETFEWTWGWEELACALTRQGTGPTAALAAAAMPRGRVQMIWGEETPRKPKAKMEALAAAAGVTPTVLPQRKLGSHQEFADDVAAAISDRAATIE